MYLKKHVPVLHVGALPCIGAAACQGQEADSGRVRSYAAALAAGAAAAAADWFGSHTGWQRSAGAVPTAAGALKVYVQPLLISRHYQQLHYSKANDW